MDRPPSTRPLLEHREITGYEPVVGRQSTSVCARRGVSAAPLSEAQCRSAACRDRLTALPENGESPCPPCPWTSRMTPDPGATYVVMGSRLPLRGYRFVPRFLAHSMRIRRQLAGADGLIGYALNARLTHKEFWTVSVWQSRDELERFAAANPHAEIIRTNPSGWASRSSCSGPASGMTSRSAGRGRRAPRPTGQLTPGSPTSTANSTANSRCRGATDCGPRSAGLAVHEFRSRPAVALHFESGASRYTPTPSPHARPQAPASVSSLVMRPWSTSAQVRHPKGRARAERQTDRPRHRLGLRPYDGAPRRSSKRQRECPGDRPASGAEVWARSSRRLLARPTLSHPRERRRRLADVAGPDWSRLAKGHEWGCRR